MTNIFLFIKSIILHLINWIRRPVNLIIKSGLTMMAIGFGGTISRADAAYTSSTGESLQVSVQSSDTTEWVGFLLVGIGIVGFLLVLFEVVSIIKKRKKVVNIAIEHIALRKRVSTPLIDSVNKSCHAATPISIDLTDCYQHDVLVSPEKALQITTVNLENTLQAQIQQMGSKDITIHYGGTPPVAFGFFAGYILGNTSKIEIWDYARDNGTWYSVEGYDDDNKPSISWDGYKAGGEDVCLLLEISYPVTTGAVGRRIGNGSYVKVSMPKVAHDNMSSIEKLKSFQSDFREILKKLNSDGVKRVHIFCAAQASFNFSMGRQINKNHPTCIVYEYVSSESGENYLWGVKMNSKTSDPEIVR